MSDLRDQSEGNGSGYNENVSSEFMDRLLDRIGASGIGGFLGNQGPLLGKIGIIGLQVSAIVGLVTAITIGLRYEVPIGPAIGAGIGWVVICVLLSFAAYKFLPALRELIEAAPSRISSTSLFDILGLAFGLGAVAILISGGFAVSRGAGIEEVVRDFFAIVIALLIMGICLNPASLNIRTEPGGSAAEEAIGILSFFLKGMIALIPLAFAVAIVLNLLAFLVIIFGDLSFAELREQRRAVGLAFGALFPLGGYLLFLFYYFMLDVVTAILAIPKIGGGTERPASATSEHRP